MKATAAVLVLALGLCACDDKGQASPASATAVNDAIGKLETLVVSRQDWPRETRYDGQLEAINQATVSAQTSGRITELNYDVGDYVEQNAVIARIADKEQRARVDAAKGVLAEAEARKTEAESNHQRAAEIYTRKLIAKADLDQAVAALEAADARYHAAQAALDEASQNLAYTQVRAPYPGIVVARHVQVGEAVAAGKPIMTGLSLSHLRAVVDIPQQHVGPLRVHHTARVIFADGTSVVASKLRIPPAADAASQSFRVLVELPEVETPAFPGSRVKVSFVTAVEPQMLLPRSAILQRGEVSAAYVIDEDQQLSLRYLRTGSSTADAQVTVLTGLRPGEKVVVNATAAAALLHGKEGGGNE